jgi:putative ABC transport system permease protein
VSTALEGLPDLDADAGSGIVGRRAVIRWGWRLFRREWRQQLLVLGLLTVAVAATIWGASVATNSQIPPGYPTFGTGAAQVTLPGTDPYLTADIATIAGRWGPADLIEKANIATGTRQSVQLRAESPHGHYNAPLLSLVSGTYPAGPGQVALTSQVAARYGAHVGSTWHAAGTTWQVTGIAADPSNLADQFALVAPGQIRHPSQAIMLLGPAAAQELLSDVTVPGVPAGNVSLPTQQVSGVSQAVFILVVEVLGLAFIGLVSVASFSVMAQRRLRVLGMLGAIGATERNLRLVMIAGGLAVGATAALAGAVLGLAAWFAYAPTVQRDTGHAVDAAHLPWWAFAIGIVLAIATSALASRRPAKTMAAVPVVTALSGRPAPPKAVHRSVLPGVIVLAAGLACLASAGGLNGVAGDNGPQGGGGNGHALFLLAGLIITITGVCLLAPLAISVLAAGAGSRLPVAIRIALRDLVRYRARSGAALAATTFAVFLAMGICIVAGIRFDNPLNWIGPDLSSSQVTVGAEQSPTPGQSTPFSVAQLATLTTRVNTLAASLHASAVPLETAGTLYQVGLPAHGVQNFTGEVYEATPQLLATYGLKASQIAPGTDTLTMRPGLAGLPHMEMLWNNGMVSDASTPPPDPGSAGGPPCTLSNHCLASPAIATVSSLPSGTSAPNTVLTEYAVSKYHIQTQLSGWLIQAPAPLTATQLSAVRQFGNANEVQVQTSTYNPSLADFTDGATALGIVIALSVLAMSVGLIRSETAPDLRTLTATGASGMTRRTITAATAAALGLLGAILGMAGAVIAGMAWSHSGLTATAGGVPPGDILILLIGLPLVAVIGGWLFAGREPPAVARRPLE